MYAWLGHFYYDFNKKTEIKLFAAFPLVLNMGHFEEKLWNR